MTDLTEQWKKCKLPDGYYYCKTENGAEILRTWRGIDGYLNFENMCNEVFISSMDDCEIIAPVPSYDDWMATRGTTQFLLDKNAQLKDKCERLEKQLKIVKKYLSLIKRNVSVGSLAYTYVANAQTEIKELEKNEETI